MLVREEGANVGGFQPGLLVDGPLQLLPDRLQDAGVRKGIHLRLRHDYFVSSRTDRHHQATSTRLLSRIIFQSDENQNRNCILKVVNRVNTNTTTFIGLIICI